MTSPTGSDEQDAFSTDALASGAEVEITSLAAGGDGIARSADGRVIFVAGGVPGDRVVLSDLSLRKKRAHARIGSIVEASPDRVEPACPYFGRCGGCQWQHVRYAAQLDAKRQIVRDALERIGGFSIDSEIEILGSPDPYGYRARARVVESKGHVGYRMRGSRDVLGVETCPVLTPATHAGLEALSKSAKDRAAREGTDEKVKSPVRSSLVEWQLTAGSDGTAIATRLGGRKKGPGQSQSVSIDVLEERLRASARSFVQGNALLWDAFAERVRSECLVEVDGRAPGDFVELYAGIGFLTLPLARRGLTGVAIESDASALADLGFNLRSNGLAGQVEIVPGRAESRGDLAGHFAGADLLLLDPPRVGLDPKVCDLIGARGPARVVYVSCDPATLARDLRSLSKAGYSLAHVEAIDLFPQTPHVEVITRLERP